MSEPITVQQLVRLRIPRHELLVDLDMREARELFDALNAEFGPSVEERDRPKLKDLLKDCFTALEADTLFERIKEQVEQGPLLRHEGMTLGATIADPFPEPGPTLNDDNGAMIERADRCPECGHATHGDVCLNMASDSECNCTFNSRQPKRDDFIDALIASVPHDADAMAGAMLKASVEAMIGNHVLESQEKVDDADEQEQVDWCPNCKNERCAGLGCNDIHPTPTCCDDWPLCDCDGPEPAEEPKPQSAVVVGSTTWQGRLLDLWAKYMNKSIQDRLKYIYTSTRNSKFAELRNMDTAMLRQALRDMGIDVPDPMSPQERAAVRRAKRLAAAGERLEPPKAQGSEQVQAKAPVQDAPVKSAELLGRFPEPLAGIETTDSLSLAFEILEHEAPQINSLVTSKAGIDAVMAFKRQIRELRTDFLALAPYERRELKAQLGAKWRESKGEAK